MQNLQSRRFSGDGPRPIARIRAPPGPRKGALQSLQRGGDGSAPIMRRMPWGKSPVSILPHISSDVSLAIGDGRYLRQPTSFFEDVRSAGAPSLTRTAPAGRLAITGSTTRARS